MQLVELGIYEFLIEIYCFMLMKLLYVMIYCSILLWSNFVTPNIQ